MTSIVKGLLPHSLLIVVSDPMWVKIQAPAPGVTRLYQKPASQRFTGKPDAIQSAIPELQMQTRLSSPSLERMVYTVWALRPE